MNVGNSLLSFFLYFSSLDNSFTSVTQQDVDLGKYLSLNQNTGWQGTNMKFVKIDGDDSEENMFAVDENAIVSYMGCLLLDSLHFFW